jgi:hypothetical protein
VHGLDHFDVMADPDRPAQLLADRRDPQACMRWRLRTLSLAPETSAALAVEASATTVRHFEWP